jgi:hypothetical protein
MERIDMDLEDGARNFDVYLEGSLEVFFKEL